MMAEMLLLELFGTATLRGTIAAETAFPGLPTHNNSELTRSLGEDSFVYPRRFP